MAERAGYWVVIPAEVFYDRELPPRAIMLYGVISNFCNYYGQCTVSNETFAKYFEVEPRSISRLLEALRARGHIVVDVYTKDGKTSRIITLALVQHRHDKNVMGGMTKMSSKINKNNNNPPIAPQGAGPGESGKQTEAKPGRRPRKTPCKPVELTPELEASFAAFWSAYPREHRRDKQTARLRWLQLSPDEAMVSKIVDSIRQLEHTDDWQRGAVPMPSTFLNNRRWEDADELPTTQQSGGVEQW